MTPREMLAAARALVDRPSPGTVGLWPRAAALLARQSLEATLEVYWSKVALGAEGSSMRAQLLCLGRYLADEPLARRAHIAWAALSEACHHHPYELAPARADLLARFDTVGALVERVEREVWGRKT